MKSPYKVCSRGRPLWVLCKKFSWGICKNQWAPNWHLQMKQQNFPSWLDLNVMEAGIMMKWGNTFRQKSLDFVIVRIPREPMEQAYGDRSQGHSTTLGLLLLCGYCSYWRETECHASDRVRCEFSWEELSTLQQVKATPSLGSSCTSYQYFGPLLHGPNPKHAVFTVSKSMWCQLLG